MLIQFIGDDSLSGPVYHGNALKSDARPRAPLLPSVASEIANSKEKPGVLYDRMRAAAGITSKNLSLSDRERYY